MADSLDDWLTTLGQDGASEPQRRIAAAARDFAAALRALPAGEYRSRAECKFTDAVTFAYVAARQ